MEKTRKKLRWLWPALLFCLSLALLFAERRSVRLALFVDLYLGAPIRLVLGRFSSLFHGSLSEYLLLFLPCILLLFVLLALRAAQSAEATKRLVSLLLLFLLSFSALYALVFAPGQNRPPVSEMLGISPSDPTEGEVLGCVHWLSALADAPGEHPGDQAITSRLLAALSAAGEEYGFPANTCVAVKRTQTGLFSRLGYFGLYSFPLGEITLLSECPDRIETFTLAHEMAHASGFAREEEADIVAFLVCLDSKDPYLVSSAASGMLGRMLTALYEKDPGLWGRASSGLSDTAERELSRAGEVYLRGASEVGGSAAMDYGETVLLLCAVYRTRGGTQQP